MGLPVHGEPIKLGEGLARQTFFLRFKAARLPGLQQCRSVGAAISAQIMATGCGLVKAAAIAAKGELALLHEAYLQHRLRVDVFVPKPLCHYRS